MNSVIKNPLFIIAEDGEVIFFHDLSELDCEDMEPIDVADGVYTAYDSEGQMLKLVTVNGKGEIERPTENVVISIPFLGSVIGIEHDKNITAIPLGIKNASKLAQILARDLSISEHNTDNLTLTELVALYERKHKKFILDD